MTTLPIPVDEETATAFRDAPEEVRAQVVHALSALARARLHPDRDALTDVREAAGRLSDSARAAGWTEAMNDALLRGDADADG